MKILFISSRYIPHVGGVEKHIEYLSNILGINNNITLVTEKHTPLLLDKEKIGNVLVYRIPLYNINEHKKKWHIWKWFYQNRDIIKNTDLIHIHDVFIWYLPFVLIYPNKKRFITFHGWEGKYPIPLKNKIVRKISEKMANGNICIGDFISKWYGTHPDIVSYGAVNPPKYKSSNMNTLLFSGRLDKDTGFDICIDLYRHLKNKFHWKLAVVGDGPNKSLAPKEAIMHGFVTDPEKYLASSRFVFTTGYLGILEAFSYKKLVISAYDNPVKKDYLYMHPMAANMVIGSDWKEITDKLNNLSPGQIAKMIENAYNWSKEQTWEKFVQQHYQLWCMK